MAKTVGTSDLLEVLGSNRVANGAPALTTPSLSTIERGFYYDPTIPSSAVINSNNVTWASTVLGEKINHVLQNGVPQWVSTTTYAIGNVVNRTNSLWIALASNTNSAPTDVNANWRKLATVDLIPTLNSLLPSQTGNANKVLKTNGTNASWDFAPFATVNFDGTTAANLTGTFTRTGSTVTANVTGHGHLVGHRIYFASTPLNEWGTVATVIDANSFTYTSGTSGAIGSTACTLNRRSIRKSTNVQSVAYGNSTGDLAINFISFAPDANYNVTGTLSTISGAPCVVNTHWSQGIGGVQTPTTAYFHMYSDRPGIGGTNVLYNHVAVFP